MSLKRIYSAETSIAATGLGTAANRYFGSGSGSVTISSTALHGTNSYQFDAAATQPRLDYVCPASQTIGYFRGYFQMTDGTPSSNSTLVYADLAAGSDMTISVTTGGLLRASFNGTNPQTGITVANDTWYGVEVEFDPSGATHAIRWRDWSAAAGWTERTTATLDQTASTISDIDFGHSGGPTSGLTVLWDDVLIGCGTSASEDFSTTTPKPSYSTRLLPTGDGTHSFTAGDFGYNAAGADIATNATDVYTYLDDADQTSLADFIRQKVIRTTGYLALTFANESTERFPRAVAVTTTHHSSSTGGNQISVRASDDNWAHETALWTNEDISDTTAHYRQAVMTTAPSGAAWTTALINSLEVRVGYSGDVTDIPYVDGVSLEIEWWPFTDAAAGLASGAATGNGDSESIKTSAGLGSGSATALANTCDIKPFAGLGTAAGTAFVVIPNVGGAAGIAAATAAAYDIVANITTGAVIATASATAIDGYIPPLIRGDAGLAGVNAQASAGLGSDIDIDNTVATIVAEAFGTSQSILAIAEAAAMAAAAETASVLIEREAGLAFADVTAYDPTLDIIQPQLVSVDAGLAGVTVFAFDMRFRGPGGKGTATIRAVVTVHTIEHQNATARILP